MMNNTSPNDFVTVFFSKEMAILIEAEWRWKANELKLLLTSPFPLITPFYFAYPIHPDVVVEIPPRIQP